MEKAKRDYKFELIRIIAIFLVVGVHVFFLLPQDGTAMRDFNIKLLNTIFPTCNALFFFISGKYALQRITPDEKLGEFYFKKFTNLIFPLVTYMLIYTVYQLWKETGSLHGIVLRSIHNINVNYNSIHFWFMYVLVGNVLISPFMSKMVNNMSAKACAIFCFFGILHNTMTVYTPYLTEGGYAWSYPFGGWAIYFYIGGCYDRIVNTDKARKWILIAGLISFLIIMWKEYFFSYNQYIHDMMPSFTFFSLMMYELLQHIKIDSEKIQDIVRFVGKRTFGIFAIHFGMIWIVVPRLPQNNHIPDIVYLFLVMTLIFIISLIVSYIIELFIINPMQRIFNTLYGKLTKQKTQI